MTPPRAPRRSTRPVVLLIGAEGSLPHLEARTRRAGWRVVRVVAIRTASVRLGPPPRWLTGARPPDVWVVTSRAVIERFWQSHSSWHPFLRRIPSVVAVGPRTARSLRAVGLRPRVAPGGGDAAALLAGMGTVRGRRVLCLRSSEAGGGLARALRRRGAVVQDRVAYRVLPQRRLAAGVRRAAREADLWLVTSPTSFRAFLAAAGPELARSRAGALRVVALGPRTAREVRRAGVGGVRRPRSATEDDFTRLVGRVLRDADS